jgi:hypothetical protein
MLQDQEWRGRRRSREGIHERNKRLPPSFARMKGPKHRQQSLKLLAHLTHWGLPPQVQQRLGAFGVLWTVFETSLETTLWALRGEQVAGVRPSTDQTQISQWITEFGKPSTKLEEAGYEVVSNAAAAAANLMEYRHALAHGWLMPFGTGASFMKNPTWNKEIRKRPSSDAHVNENLLDLAIDCVWILCSVVFATTKVCSDKTHSDQLVALKDDVARANTEAGELRHLATLMNYKKY